MENKSILVIDTPEDCLACPCFNVIGSEHCSVTMKEVGLHIPKWCPLKPLPSKLVPFGYLDAGNEDGLYEKGYNDCIDEITGENE